MPARNVTLRFLSEDNLSAELAGAMSHGGNVALVANTVSRARKLYCALRSLFPGEVHLLHARYRVKDRQQRVAEALARVSRNSVRPFRSLLISTQVIEQSLDIDFDLLISELPPVDLLLQRMGRLHRHERQPHPSFPHPATWILDPPLTGGLPRFGDSAYVYAPHILLRSWWTLKDLPGLVLPDQIDSLIEAVYGDQPNPCEGVLAKEWNSTLENMQRARTLEEANAQEAYIGAPHFTDPINLVRNLADAERKIAATRQFRRSVSLVVLYAGRGDRLLLEPDDPVGISIYDDLTIDQIRLLLERSVTLPLRSQEAIPPAEFDLPSAWRKRTALESLKLLKLDEDHCGKTGDLELGLDPELGLCRRGENPTNLTV